MLLLVTCVCVSWVACRFLCLCEPPQPGNRSNLVLSGGSGLAEWHVSLGGAGLDRRVPMAKQSCDPDLDLLLPFHVGLVCKEFSFAGPGSSLEHSQPCVAFGKSQAKTGPSGAACSGHRGSCRGCGCMWFSNFAHRLQPQLRKRIYSAMLHTGSHTHCVLGGNHDLESLLERPARVFSSTSMGGVVVLTRLRSWLVGGLVVAASDLETTLPPPRLVSPPGNGGLPGHVFAAEGGGDPEAQARRGRGH